jgi:hypothetical protein
VADICFDSANWNDLCAKVTAAGIDLEALAVETAALRRRRRVRDAQTLLRLALAYGGGPGSLQTVSAWAAGAGIAKLSKVALMKRLAAAADLLFAVAGRLLAQRSKVAMARLGSRPLRLVDASCISKPGSVGTDWRLHAMLDPARQRFVDLELTDAKGAEGFDRFPVLPGEIRIGDRGYISCGGLRHVLDGGGDFLIRAGWNAFRLRQADGTPFDLIATLRQAGDRLDQWIAIADPKHAEPLKVRLVAARKSPAAAERDRRNIRQNAKRRGKTPDARSLEAAGWIILITSLDGVAADDILALYRLRWQIELAFKRLKSLAGLDRLPARGAALARAWIAAKLIIATLIGMTIEEFLDTPGVGAAIDTRPPSIWCVFHLALQQISHLVWCVDPYPNFALADPALRRHLCDSPRKRRKQLSLAFTFR